MSSNLLPTSRLTHDKGLHIKELAELMKKPVVEQTVAQAYYLQTMAKDDWPCFLEALRISLSKERGNG